jgi:hypothetical protein
MIILGVDINRNTAIYEHSEFIHFISILQIIKSLNLIADLHFGHSYL